MFKILFSILLFGWGLQSAEPSRIEAVIFDCDGTLVDNEYLQFIAWRDALKLRGHELKEEDFFPYFPGRPGIEIVRIFDERFGIDSTESFIRDRKRIYLELLNQGHAVPIERTVRLVRELAERKEELGIQLGVASASTKDHILINLKHLELEETFDVIISGRDDLGDYSDPEGVNKPKPYIYLEAAKRLGVDPSHCIAFEDTNTGVRAAVGAGIKTFAVPNAYTQAQDFSLAHQILAREEEMNADQLFKVLSQEKFFSN